MTRLRSIQVLALAGLAVLCFAKPLRAQGITTQRFFGLAISPLPSFSVHPALPTETVLTFPIINKYVGITSNVSPLGYVSGTLTILISADRLSRTGTIELIDRKGNRVFITYAVSRTPSTNFSGTFTIVGGTGKFVGAAGGGDLRHWQWIGQLSYPDGKNYIETYFDNGWITY